MREEVLDILKKNQIPLSELEIQKKLNKMHYSGDYPIFSRQYWSICYNRCPLAEEVKR